MCEKAPRDSPPVRQSHPLADAPTPLYLQRFSYTHSGQTHHFDEHSYILNHSASNDPPTSSKRSLPRQEAAPPAPKRRERSYPELSALPDCDLTLNDNLFRSFSNVADATIAEVAETPPRSANAVFPRMPMAMGHVNPPPPNQHAHSFTNATTLSAPASSNPAPCELGPNSAREQSTEGVQNHSGLGSAGASHRARPLSATNNGNPAMSSASGATASFPEPPSRGDLLPYVHMLPRLDAYLDRIAQQQLPSSVGPDLVNDDGPQPALLSPTASPLGSPNLSEDERELSSSASPVLTTPGTAGPPSALVLTPLPPSRHGVPVHPLDHHRPLPNVGSASQPVASSIPRLLTPRLPYLPSVQLHESLVRQHLQSLTSTFGEIPAGLHRYALFNLLRMCDRRTMSALYGEMERALRFDIVGNLPPELSSMVLVKLDKVSVFHASCVCRNWYRLVDGDDLVWLGLAVAENLHPTKRDWEAARVERWGYTGWATLRNRPAEMPVNLFGKPVNVHKALFRRLMMIHQNWMRAGELPRLRIRCPDREVITCLDFSDDIIIASTEARQHLNVYDTKTGLLLHEFSDHDGGVWALKRVGLNTIVTGSTDHTVRVWSLKQGRCTHVFRGHNATVRCLDVVMPANYTPLPDNSSSANSSFTTSTATSAAKYSGIGESPFPFPLILTGSRDTTMRLWRLPAEDDKDYDSKIAFIDRENPYFVGELRGHQESVRAVCGYGNVAVSGSYDFRVRVWDLTTRKCRHELEGHENKVYAVIIDPDRNRCISTSMDMHIIIWDLNTGAQLYKLHGHTGLVGLVSLRDNALVTAAADKTLRVWDPDTGALVHTLEGHNTAILCFVHDGRRIVSGSERHLKLWDTRTGEFCRDLLTGMDVIWQVSVDRRRCCAAVMRDRCSFLEVLNFDFDRNDPSRISPVKQ